MPWGGPWDRVEQEVHEILDIVNLAVCFSDPLLNNEVRICSIFPLYQNGNPKATCPPSDNRLENFSNSITFIFQSKHIQIDALTKGSSIGIDACLLSRSWINLGSCLKTNFDE